MLSLVFGVEQHLHGFLPFRLILAAMSPFLRELLLQHEDCEIVLPDVDKRTFTLLLVSFSQIPDIFIDRMGRVCLLKDLLRVAGEIAFWLFNDLDFSRTVSILFSPLGLCLHRPDHVDGVGLGVRA